MSARPLKSDQVNYLIWRYLQESGHAQTAARLQRDWGRADPQRLPFAQHIRTHALVHLLQKGLRYHELETSVDQNGQRQAPSSFFGPDTGSASPPHELADNDDESTGSRKHLRDSVSHEADANSLLPSAKRSRRSNGAAINGSSRTRPGGEGMDLDPSNAAAAAHGNLAPTTATKRESGPATSATSPASNNAPSLAANSEMELDSTRPADSNPAQPLGPNQTAAHQRSPPHSRPKLEPDAADASDTPPEALAAPEPQAVPTLVNGSSVGVQSDKVAELGPETGVLGVPGRNVTHAVWSPTHPGVLAAAGDALCRLWILPTATPAPAPSNGFTRHPRPVQPSASFDLNENRAAYYVTSIAWSDSGDWLAVAKHPTTPGQRGVIGIYDRGGFDVDELPGSQDFVLNLIWNPQSTLLLGISHSGENASSIMAWDARGARVIQPLRVEHTVWDAAWVDDRYFFICARNYVAKAEVAHLSVDLVNERAGEALTGDWSRIRHDVHTNLTALSADGSPATIGLSSGSGLLGTKEEAHSADITALMFQPLAGNAAARTQPGTARILASASVDGTIKLWNASRHLELVHELEMGRASPVLAMAFTPDGFLIAGASADRVLVWNTETGGFPKAKWNGKDIGWQSNGNAHVNGNGHAPTKKEGENGDVEMADGDEDDDEPVPTLGWDADGKKLVCAMRNQLAIISLRR